VNRQVRRTYRDVDEVERSRRLASVIVKTECRMQLDGRHELHVAFVTARQTVRIVNKIIENIEFTSLHLLILFSNQCLDNNTDFINIVVPV